MSLAGHGMVDLPSAEPSHAGPAGAGGNGPGPAGPAGNGPGPAGPGGNGPGPAGPGAHAVGQGFLAHAVGQGFLAHAVGQGFLAHAVSRLAHAGVDSPRADAEQLAAHVLGVPRGALVLADWSAADLERFEALVGYRAARIPLQYLVGSVGFRRLELAVGPGVFVPRPETETVIDAALRLLAPVVHPRVVDLCTGSGAIALALAQEHPGAQVLAVEADPGAAEWARRNIDAAGLPVRLLVGDVQAVPAALNGAVDLVVSNPPYIPDGAALPPEVARHEPAAALYAGADGLDGVRAVERVARRLLRPGGSAVVEHGDEQAPAVVTLFASWDDAVSHQDLAGRDRFVTARRRAGP